jgi:hypothetical protein
MERAASLVVLVERPEKTSTGLFGDIGRVPREVHRGLEFLLGRGERLGRFFRIEPRLGVLGGQTSKLLGTGLSHA